MSVCTCVLAEAIYYLHVKFSGAKCGEISVSRSSGEEAQKESQDGDRAYENNASIIIPCRRCTGKQSKRIVIGGCETVT